MDQSAESAIQYAIYEYPERFVVRRWRVLSGYWPESEASSQFASLEDARASLPPGVARLVDINPVQAIVEVWA